MKPAGIIKITSGIYHGRTISSPNNNATHPMGSRERLALMNSLGPDVLNGAKVLDAFAGTGALGLEALSRGAESAVFVENHHAAATAIRQNLELLQPKNAKLFEQSVETFCESYEGSPFSLIFADPPYDKISKEKLEPLVNLLEKDGILVISHPEDFDPLSVNSSDAPLELLSTRKMAAANISILRKKC